MRVPRLPLLRLTEPFLPFPFERCVVTRLARQKNDVPGPFHPARVDAALRNAAFDSSEIIAGNGVAWCEMEEKETLPHSFHCDPGLVLSEEGQSSTASSDSTVRRATCRTSSSRPTRPGTG
ncbi:MAG: hypothetical protein L6W00_01990 [Lentisphaeria bacterium]|nr:MAG: hypothetical protein L6W00_01990 [Lentisphaeria bacterium]